MHSRTKGFTLIELAIVIVVIAIISVVAMPKFINLSDDAKKAKIASVAADLRIAIDLIYYKSLILGLDDKCYDKTADDSDASKDQSAQVEGYLTCYGYPIAYQDSITRLLNLGDEFTVTNSARPYTSSSCDGGATCEKHRVLVIAIGDKFTHKDTDGDYCQLLYQPNSLNQIVVFDSAC